MNQNSFDLKYILIAIGVIVLLVFGFLLSFVFLQRKKLKYQKEMQLLQEVQQNQLIEAAVRSEELERHRIAEALHDEVGAILSSSKLHHQNIKAAALDERSQQLHAKGMELLDDAIQKVRGISHNLHSNILKEFGLNEAIRHFVNKVTQGTFLNASTELDNNYSTQNTDNDMSIYRTVQELVNNILKHAAATELRIYSVYDAGLLRLTLFHNGNGLTQQQFEALRFKKDGLGLKNIQNRIILLRGTLEFSRSNEGYSISIRIPVQTTAA